MPLTGEAKREYQRLYMRGRRGGQVKEVAEAITRVLKPPRGRPKAFTEPVEDAARAGLALALRSNRLDLETVLQKVREKLEATRWFNAAKVVDGKSQTEAIIAGDNDAQLRAADLALRLHERAGTIPASPVEGRGGGGVSVAIHFVMPGQPQDVVVEAESTSVRSDG